MRERTKCTIQPRWVSGGDLALYLGLGRNLAVELGNKLGARRQIGRIVRYDLHAIDRELDKLGGVAAGDNPMGSEGSE